MSSSTAAPSAAASSGGGGDAPLLSARPSLARAPSAAARRAMRREGSSDARRGTSSDRAARRAANPTPQEALQRRARRRAAKKAAASGSAPTPQQPATDEGQSDAGAPSDSTLLSMMHAFRALWKKARDPAADPSSSAPAASAVAPSVASARVLPRGVSPYRSTLGMVSDDATSSSLDSEGETDTDILAATRAEAKKQGRKVRQEEGQAQQQLHQQQEKHASSPSASSGSQRPCEYAEFGCEALVSGSGDSHYSNSLSHHLSLMHAAHSVVKTQKIQLGQMLAAENARADRMAARAERRLARYEQLRTAFRLKKAALARARQMQSVADLVASYVEAGGDSLSATVRAQRDEIELLRAQMAEKDLLLAQAAEFLRGGGVISASASQVQPGSQSQPQQQSQPLQPPSQATQAIQPEQAPEPSTQPTEPQAEAQAEVDAQQPSQSDSAPLVDPHGDLGPILSALLRASFDSKSPPPPLFSLERAATGSGSPQLQSAGAPPPLMHPPPLFSFNKPQPKQTPLMAQLQQANFAAAQAHHAHASREVHQPVVYLPLPHSALKPLAGLFTTSAVREAAKEMLPPASTERLHNHSHSHEPGQSAQVQQASASSRGGPVRMGILCPQVWFNRAMDSMRNTQQKEGN